METATLHLDLTVNYTLNGISVEHLQEQIRSIISRSIQEGALTGFTEAEVDEWDMDIVANPTHHHDHIREHLHSRLVKDALSPELLSEKMTEYGLMSVSDFLDEMQERGAIHPRL